MTVKQTTYEDAGNMEQRAASLLAEIPSGSRIIKLSGDNLSDDVQYWHIGAVRVLQAYDVISDKIFTRYDVGYECTSPKPKAHTGK